MMLSVGFASAWKVTLRAVVERLKHPGLQNIVDDQLNDRRQAACKGKLDEFPQLCML